MSKKNIKILYDKESEVLLLEMKRVKSADSDIQDNMVVDYDEKGDIVRINLYDFSFASFRSAESAFRSFARDSGAALSVR